MRRQFWCQLALWECVPDCGSCSTTPFLMPVGTKVWFALCHLLRFSFHGCMVNWYASCPNYVFWSASAFVAACHHTCQTCTSQCQWRLVDHIYGRVHAVTWEFCAVSCHDMDHVASLSQHTVDRLQNLAVLAKAYFTLSVVSVHTGHSRDPSMWYSIFLPTF